MSKVKLVAFDCDGVLTDNTFIYTDREKRIRTFNTSDGVACSLLKAKGVLIAIISSAEESSIQQRAEDMGVDYCCTGIKNKLEVLQEICHNKGISIEDVVYVGNDVADIEILENVGYPFCPSDAEIEVKINMTVNITTVLSVCGGRGVIRVLFRYLDSLELI